MRRNCTGKKGKEIRRLAYLWFEEAGGFAAVKILVLFNFGVVLQYSDGPSVGRIMKNYRISYATIRQPIVQGVQDGYRGCNGCRTALRSMRHLGVMPGEYRRPAGLFAALCHNAFVRKRGKRVYAVGKTRRSFWLKQSHERHSFFANARVSRACAKIASLEGCLIDDAYKALRERAKSSAYKSRWLSKVLSA